MALVGLVKPGRTALFVCALLAVSPARAAVNSCALQARVGQSNCPLPQASTTTVPQPPQPHDGHGPSIIEVLGYIAAIFIIIALADALTGRHDASVDELDSQGPKAPNEEAFGRYQVQGLIYPDWPVVVEVNARPEATTYVQIVPSNSDQQRRLTYVISEGGGRPWGDLPTSPVELSRTDRGMLAKFMLPHRLDGRASNDGFRSARISVLSGHMEGDSFVPEPVEVFALGAGPNAVGSAAVVISRFAPAALDRRADFDVTFNRRRQFAQLHAKLIERRQQGNTIKRVEAGDSNLCGSEPILCASGPSVEPYRTGGSWPQPGTANLLDSGKSYHMELRAWSQRSPKSGWIIDQAPQALSW